LFGEKYADLVRVVIIDPNFSAELCGGTHVGATGELGYFKITHETAIASGIRRMEAISGKAAELYIEEQFSLIHSIREVLKNPKDVSRAIDILLNENAALKKKAEAFETKELIVLKTHLLQKLIKINGINFVGEIVEVGNVEALKKLCLELKNQLTEYVVVLTANVEGKAIVAIMIEEKISFSKNLDASKIIKDTVAPLIKGGGGGQRTLATAGGQDAGNLKTVIDKVKALI
jgi:alanyl-tRNA synthetase